MIAGYDQLKEEAKNIEKELPNCTFNNGRHYLSGYVDRRRKQKVEDLKQEIERIYEAPKDRYMRKWE